MILDPPVKKYFGKTLALLPKHPFFKSSEENPPGRPIALEKCKLTLRDFLNGKPLTELNQAQLEFILALCQGRKMQGLMDIPHEELRPLVRGVKSLLQMQFYMPLKRKNPTPCTHCAMSQHVWGQTYRPFRQKLEGG